MIKLQKTKDKTENLDGSKRMKKTYIEKKKL